MSKIKSIASTIRRWIAPRRYYTAPKEYWEERHDSFGTSLEGVGRLNLDEAGNAHAYEQKWAHVSAALHSLGDPTTMTLLDAGCGTGWLTQKFGETGYSVAAVDFTHSGVNHARSRLSDDSVEWFVSDLATFRPAREFDVVVCIDVLFHIVDDVAWEAAVRNLLSLTKPGGHLLIQDHLVGDTEMVPSRTDGTVHTRWRSLATYQRVLDDATLSDHDHYEVSAEQTTKDLLLFETPSR